MASARCVRWTISFFVFLIVSKIFFNQTQIILAYQQSNGFIGGANEAIQVKNSVAYVTIADTLIEPKRLPEQIQKFKAILRHNCAKFSTIVLNLTHCKKQGNTSVTSLFLQTLFVENISRSYKNLEPFQLFFYISSETVQNSDPNRKCLVATCFDAFLYNYATYSQVVSGVIVDSSLISSSLSKQSDFSNFPMSEILKRISQVNEYSRILKGGKKLKVGIIIHSLKEYEEMLEKIPTHVLSQLGIAVYNEHQYKWIGSAVITMESENQEKGFQECNQILLLYVSKPRLYTIQEFYF